MARMCCSNWLVALASIVAWPLLWTRGASSLTTSGPSGQQEQLDGQEPDQVHRVGERRTAMRLGRVRDSRRTRSAGSTDSSQDAAVMDVPERAGTGRVPTVQGAGADDRQLGA